MIKIGLLGVGHLGKIHLKLLHEIADFEVIGFYDPNEQAAAWVQSHYPALPRFTDAATLIAATDAVDIVAPTLHHSVLALEAIAQKKHIFIEKPLAATLAEGKQLAERATAAGIIGQVGHVERFNPAFLALKDKKLQPLFIETHRLAIFNPRGTDVSVVMDLMIHDLDMVRRLVGSEVTAVHASGVAIVSTNPDIANARLTFANGCIANITASRISMKNLRKMRIFQPDAYISLDFLEKKSEILQLFDDEPQDVSSVRLDIDTQHSKFISYVQNPTEAVNAIKMELEYFAKSIRQQMPPPVTFQDGYEALRLALWVSNEIEAHAKTVRR
ncbi:MAG: Gfo/Idh/MocA family oxidoreductase [Sphingobacteriales bacterium]|nr:Gfo/Idh/MocA family oxidoreductase [Sphingobacteriales bacterium]